MDPLAASLARSPELFPHTLDLRSGTVTLLHLSRADYEQASFLDGRIAGPAKPGRTLPFTQLAASVTAASLPERCYFIFHIGHVGSTLLSRLLGRHPAIFSLREPDILRTLALTQNAAVTASHLPVFLRLWSRTFDPTARAVVKASSFVSDLAPQILAQDYAPRALILGVTPESYLATIFAGPNAPKEAHALAPFRLARLRARLDCAWSIADKSEGEIVALGWICESLALDAAAAQSGNRVRVINFDRFLAQPQQQLREAFAHFDVAVSDTEIARILDGPEMKTYSKAPEHSYDTALRQSLLKEGRARFGAEIHRGLSWIDRVAREFSPVANALCLFADG